MSPNFGTQLPPKKKSSGGTFAIVAVVLVAAAGGGGWYFVKGPGRALVAKSSSAPAPAAEGTPPAAAPEVTTPAPAGAAPSAEAPKEAPGKPAEKAEAKPAEAKPAETKSAEAKPSEAKPADTKSGEAKSEGKPHKGKRRGGGASTEAAAPAEAAPAVADVSPKAAEEPKAGGDTAAPSGDAKAAAVGHVLKITSSPAGAEVIVDGTSMGTTPFSSGDVDPALPHSVTIKKDGFEAYEHMLSGSDWPRAKNGVRTLKLSAKLRSTGGGEGAKPAAPDSPAAEPPPGLGTTPASPKRE